MFRDASTFRRPMRLFPDAKLRIFSMNICSNHKKSLTLHSVLWLLYKKVRGSDAAPDDMRMRWRPLTYRVNQQEIKIIH